jgi:hypothetical protein
MVEMLLCMKDWELGDARAQHSVQDKELEAAFEGLYLDEEQPDLGSVMMLCIMCSFIYVIFSIEQ